MKKKLQILFFTLAFFSLPFLGKSQILSESFEGTFPPTGWLLLNNGTGNNWTQNTNSAANKVSDGTKSMRYVLSANPADAWAFTSALSLTAGTTYTLTFDYIVQSANKPEKLKVTVGTAQTVVSQTTTLWDNNGGSGLTNTSFAQATIQFTPTTTATYYYAFNCYSAANHKRLYIDKVSITAPSSGTCPDPSNQTVTSLSTSSAQLNWTSGGSNNYNIEYGPAGFTQGTGTMISVATDTFTVINSLSAGTTYEWYVQDSCGVGDVSAWVGPNSFMTNCGTYTPNYSEDFATYIPNCWSEAKGLLQTNTTFTSSSSLWTADGFANVGNTGAARVRIKGQIRSWLISPSIDLSGGNYQLEFDMALTEPATTNDTSLAIDDSIVVVISTDNGATWNKANKLKTWTSTSTISNVGEHQVIDLSAYNTTVKIAFYTPSSVVNAETEYFIDNFLVTASTNINVDLGNDTTICEGESISLNSGSPSSYTHLWTFDGDTLSVTTPSITIDTAGIYSVEVSNGIDTAYDTLVLAVNPLPSVSVSPLATTICEGDSAVVNITFTGTAPWVFSVSNGTNVFTDSSTTASIHPVIDEDSTISYNFVSIMDGNGSLRTNSILLR